MQQQDVWKQAITTPRSASMNSHMKTKLWLLMPISPKRYDTD